MDLPENIYRQELTDALHLLAKSKDVIRDTHGNLSLRTPFDTCQIKPSGVEYDQITPEMICEVQIEDGGILGQTDWKPSVDLQHHLEIYRNNPWVGVICHTHSPYATAMAAIQWSEMPCYTTEQADYFGGPIRILVYRDLHSWGSAVKLKDGERAVLLEHHGVLTFGKTPIEAVKLAVALENVAQKNCIAISIRPPGIKHITSLAPDEIKKWHDRYINEYGQK